MVYGTCLFSTCLVLYGTCIAFVHGNCTNRRGRSAPSLPLGKDYCTHYPPHPLFFACCAPYCLLCLPCACMQCLHVNFNSGPGPRFAGDLSRQAQPLA